MVSQAVVGAAGVAFLVAIALVPMLVRFAIGRDLLDVPNARSSHEIPTPRLGGLAVIAGVWAAAPFIDGGAAVLVAATFTGFVGILDDVFDLRVWIVAVVNAYNFMDGIDGIAGGTAILNALFLAALAGDSSAGDLGVGLAALAAAVAGFPGWNGSPGRDFLGD